MLLTPIPLLIVAMVVVMVSLVVVAFAINTAIITQTTDRLLAAMRPGSIMRSAVKFAMLQTILPKLAIKDILLTLLPIKCENGVRRAAMIAEFNALVKNGTW